MKPPESSSDNPYTQHLKGESLAAFARLQIPPDNENPDADWARRMVVVGLNAFLAEQSLFGKAYILSTILQTIETWYPVSSAPNPPNQQQYEDSWSKIYEKPAIGPDSTIEDLIKVSNLLILLTEHANEWQLRDNLMSLHAGLLTLLEKLVDSDREEPNRVLLQASVKYLDPPKAVKSFARYQDMRGSESEGYDPTEYFQVTSHIIGKVEPISERCELILGYIGKLFAETWRNKNLILLGLGFRSLLKNVAPESRSSIYRKSTERHAAYVTHINKEAIERFSANAFLFRFHPRSNGNILPQSIRDNGKK